MISLIAAIDRKFGLAKHGIMPWNIPEDEKFFSVTTRTRGANVLTGGETFRLAYGGQALPERQNFILTRSATPIPDATLVHDITVFLSNFKDDLWIAGGGQVFEQALPFADELLITHIDADFGCDRFFPQFGSEWQLAERSEDKEQNGFHYFYATYRKQ